MKLTLIDVVRREEKHAPGGDMRRRLTYVVAGYRGEDGHEYRKAFEAYGTPVVPMEGTHKTLNALNRQWDTNGHE